MTYCCVPGCKMRGGHRFPKDSTLRKKWIHAVRRKNWKPTLASAVCTSHFDTNDYYTESYETGLMLKNKRLKAGVVPTVFTWNNNAIPNIPSGRRQRLEKNISKQYSTPIVKEAEVEADNNAFHTSDIAEEIIVTDNLNEDDVEIRPSSAGAVRPRLYMIYMQHIQCPIKDEYDAGPSPGVSPSEQSEEEMYPTPLFQSFSSSSEVSERNILDSDWSDSAAPSTSAGPRRSGMQTLRPSPQPAAPVYSVEPTPTKSRVNPPKPVCRLCMKTSTVSMVLIYNDVNKKESLVDKIQAVTGLVMVDGDGLPRQICHPCLKRITEWYSYKQLCFRSDTKFRALASAMQQAPPGKLFTLAAAKPQPKKTSTITSSKSKTPASSTVVTGLASSSYQQFESEASSSYQQLESEASDRISVSPNSDCNTQQREGTLAFENVVVKLEKQDFRDFDTSYTQASYGDEEHFEEPAIKIENEIDPCSYVDPLASDMSEVQMPESHVSYNRDEPVLSFPDPATVPFSSDSRLIVTGLPGNVAMVPFSSGSRLIVPLLPGNVAMVPFSIPMTDTQELTYSEPKLVCLPFQSCVQGPSDDVHRVLQSSTSFSSSLVEGTSVKELDPMRQERDDLVSSETDNPSKRQKIVPDSGDT